MSDNILTIFRNFLIQRGIRMEYYDNMRSYGSYHSFGELVDDYKSDPSEIFSHGFRWYDTDEYDDDECTYWDDYDDEWRNYLIEIEVFDPLPF